MGDTECFQHYVLINFKKEAFLARNLGQFLKLYKKQKVHIAKGVLTYNMTLKNIELLLWFTRYRALPASSFDNIRETVGRRYLKQIAMLLH